MCVRACVKVAFFNLLLSFATAFCENNVSLNFFLLYKCFVYTKMTIFEKSSFIFGE